MCVYRRPSLVSVQHGLYLLELVGVVVVLRIKLINLLDLLLQTLSSSVAHPCVLICPIVKIVEILHASIVFIGCSRCL